MTLTTNGKNYIARNFGIGNCWVYSGLTWTSIGVDGSTAEESGGTASIVGRLVNTSVFKEVRLKSPRTGTYTYAQLKAANDNQSIALSPDVVFIVNNDGYPSGEPKYCISAVTPTPTPTPSPTPTPITCDELIRSYGALIRSYDSNGDRRINTAEVSKASYDKYIGKISDAESKAIESFWKMGCIIPDAVPTPTPTPTPGPTPTPTPTPTPGVTPTPPPSEVAGVFVFKGPITGDPTVNLDLSGLKMKQATDGHFEMNDIKIINTSTRPVYLAMRVRLFSGTLSYCPAGGERFDGMDRTYARNVRVKTLEVGETAEYDADFYQPATIAGTHTVCLLVHGAWSRADLTDEIEYVYG